jgi:hypothetical protein
MTHHLTAKWRPLAVTYNNHHMNCAHCISAGQGRGTRCATGAPLWAGYQKAAA